MSLFKTDGATQQIIFSMKKHQNNKRLSDRELKKKIKATFRGTPKRYKKYLSTIAFDINRFGERPQALYWVAVMDNTFGEIKASGTYDCYDWDKVFKRISDIFFDDTEMDTKIMHAEKYLDGKGIVLRNSEYIHGSQVNSCLLKKEGQIYLYMNDKRKREYQYIYVLLRELEFLYTGKNNNIDELIKEYEEKYNKSHEELDLAMKIFESDELVEMKWELLRVQTHKRINFTSGHIGF